MESIQDALKAYDAVVERIGGCGDGYCIITGRRRGQHTNGGCHCFRRPSEEDGIAIRQLILAGRRLRDAIGDIDAEG